MGSRGGTAASFANEVPRPFTITYRWPEVVGPGTHDGRRVIRVTVVGVDYALTELILTVGTVAHLDEIRRDREEVVVIAAKRAFVVMLATERT